MAEKTSNLLVVLPVDLPRCSNCGFKTVPSGTAFVCTNCGTMNHGSEGDRGHDRNDPKDSKDRFLEEFMEVL